MPKSIEDLIAEAADQYNVPYEVALAVAQVESGMNQNARGAAGEVGVFQVIPRWHVQNARRMGLDLYSVRGNVEYGVWLLGSSIEREGGSIVKGLRRYNGGPNYGSDTKAYADKVMNQVKSLTTGVRPIRTGSTSSGFGQRERPDNPGEFEDHGGIDIQAPEGTPVFASVGGTIQRVRHLKSSFGSHIVIKGVDGREYWYAHLSSIGVEVGQEVRTGQRIGTVGSTGRATGPHLHFEVREEGKSVDPTPWLNGQAPPPSADDDEVGDFESERLTFAEMLATAFATDIETAMGATDQLLSSMGITPAQQATEAPVAQEPELGLDPDAQVAAGVPDVSTGVPDVMDDSLADIGTVLAGAVEGLDVGQNDEVI